jgi:hypothetical protein
LVWRHTDTSATAVRTIVILAWRQPTAQSLRVEGIPDWLFCWFDYHLDGAKQT